MLGADKLNLKVFHSQRQIIQNCQVKSKGVTTQMGDL